MSMENKFIENMACPTCNGSKSAARYKRPDGKEYYVCYKPDCTTKGKTQYDFKKFSGDNNNNKEDSVYRPPYGKQFLTREIVNEYPSSELTSRGISLPVAELYGVKVSENLHTNDIDTHYFPFFIKKQLSGYKVIRLPKEFKPSVGSISNCDPFGWHLIRPGKRLIITEGEYDCMSVYQSLTNWAVRKGYDVRPQVISLSNGVGSVRQLISKFSKVLNQFKEIVLCFDSDDAGQKAIIDFSTLYEGTTLVMQLPEKDANDVLLEHGESTLVDCYFRAKPPELGEMQTLGSVIDSLVGSKETAISYPWPAMTVQSKGNRESEIIVIGAGTGVGKSLFTSQLAAHFATEHNMPVSYYSLEMSMKSMSDVLVKAAHPDSLELLQKNIRLYDTTKGMLTPKRLILLMKQQAILHGVKVHVIDNLSQLASTSGDERLSINDFIKDLKDITEKYKLRVLLVSHLGRLDRKSIPFEEGARTSIHHLYGSSAVEKWANTIITLERNLLHSKPEIRNITICRWQKDRYSGEAPGHIFALCYNKEDGRLIPTKPIDIIEKREREEDEVEKIRRF